MERERKGVGTEREREGAEEDEERERKPNRGFCGNWERHGMSENDLNTVKVNFLC